LVEGDGLDVFYDISLPRVDSSHPLFVNMKLRTIEFDYLFQENNLIFMVGEFNFFEIFLDGLVFQEFL
jgi:hypothetical protein